MGKRKPASKVAVAAPSPANPLKNGKREAEVVIEKDLVSAKKQKISENKSEDAVVPAEKSAPAAAPESAVAKKKKKKKKKKNKKANRSDEDGVVPAEKAAPAAAPEPAVAKKKKKKKQSIVDFESKTLYVGNLSFKVKKDDVLEFFKSAGEVVDVRLAVNPADGTFRGFGHVDFATAKEAEKALQELNGKELLRREIRLDLTMEKGKVETCAAPPEPAVAKKKKKKKKQSIGGGSKTLYVGNLSFNVQQGDVEEFFKSAGNVVDVRLAVNPEDGLFRGFGHVEYSTAKEAEKALQELNGKALLGRAIRLDLTKGKVETPYEKRKKMEVSVKGFDPSQGEDSVRAWLMAHFACCGQIKRVSVPLDQDGNVQGIAYIQFVEENARSLALELGNYGSLSVREAMVTGLYGGGGRGGRRGGGGDGGRGRGRGRGRG